jgi:hypothetical protein
MEITTTLTSILIHQPICVHRCTLNHHHSQHHPTRDQSTQYTYQESKPPRNNSDIHRSAEDALLCRSSEPRIWGMQERVPDLLNLPCLRQGKQQECRGRSPLPGFGVSPTSALPAAAAAQEAGVQRTQSFAGVRGVPDQYLACHRRRHKRKKAVTISKDV